MKDRIDLIADILMSAAYADGRLVGEEKLAIAKLLREILGVAKLPMDLEFRIQEFSDGAFDMEKAAAEFVAEPPGTKRALLQLVAAVHGSDAEHDFDEDAHLRRLAKAIGLPEKDYADMVIDILEEADLADDLATVRGGAAKG
jgi:uncharacterized tellurite resistance protein B-like protein